MTYHQSVAVALVRARHKVYPYRFKRVRFNLTLARAYWARLVRRTEGRQP